jgi:hypothetical protein
MAKHQQPPTQPSRVPGTIQNTAKNSDNHTVDYYFSVLDKVGRQREHSPQALAAPAAYDQKIDIEQEAAREQKIRNDNAEQDIRLKKVALNWLFGLLLGETTLIFLFSIFQGVRWPHNFHLEDWSFKLLVTATIAQITGMLFVAVRYLFPSGSANK